MSDQPTKQTTERSEYPYQAQGYVIFDRSQPADRPVASVRGDQHGLYHAQIIADALNRHRQERPDLYVRARRP